MGDKDEKKGCVCVCVYVRGGRVEGGGFRVAVWSLALSSCKNALSELDDTSKQNNLYVCIKIVKLILLMLVGSHSLCACMINE